MGVTFPTDFQNNNNIFMTVEQTPVNQTMFYDQRLLGTDFANENCIIYLGTGGNCVLYTVTCQDSMGNNGSLSHRTGYEHRSLHQVHNPRANISGQCRFPARRAYRLQ